MASDPSLFHLFSYNQSSGDVHIDNTYIISIQEKPMSTMYFLSHFLSAFICFTGIFGDILSALTFLSNSLRSSICSINLALRCLNDAVFLLSTFLIQIAVMFHLEIKDFKVLYEILLTVQRTSGLLSSWLFVLLLLENTILLKYPCYAKRLYAENFQVKLVIVFVSIACVMNIGYVAASHGRLVSDISILHTIMSYFLFVFGFPLPFLVSVIIMVVIIRIVRRILSYKRRRQSVISIQPMHACNVKSPVSKVTKMLVIYLISMTFLSFPSYFCYFMKLIGVLDVNNKHWIQMLRSGILTILRSINASFHFFIFFKFSSNYRQALTLLVSCRNDPVSRKSSILSATESTQRRRRSTIVQKVECTARPGNDEVENPDIVLVDADLEKDGLYQL